MAVGGAENYEKSLAALKQMESKYKSIGKSVKYMESTWDSISTSIFKISGSDWFKKVPKTTEELKLQYEELDKIKIALSTMGNELSKSITESMGEGTQKLLKQYEDSISLSNKSINASIRTTLGDKIDPEGFQNIANILNKTIGTKKKFSEIAGELAKFDKDKIIDEKTYQELQKKAKAFKVDEDMIYQSILISEKDSLENMDESIKKKYIEAVATGKIGEFIEKNGDEAIRALITQKQLKGEIASMAIEYQKTVKTAKELEEELKKTEKTAFSISKGFEKIAINFARDIIPRILQFDDAIHTAQKDTGIMFTENAASMTALTVKTARFGMSIEDTAKFMGEMSEELQTTNFGVLAQAAGDLKEVQLATGISSENLTKIAGELMRMGKSSANVADSISYANVQAKSFGVNAKKVLEGMARNITKMRTMGFVGGEKSLARMVAKAESLRMNIDEIFNVADKARSIEGAMEMAAQLQLAGGSFANMNPMDLLSAARKGPEELQKILTTMGGDIGTFDEKTKEMKFDPIDKDRLQIVADATGQTLDSITNMITKNAENNKKIQIMPDLKFTGLKDKNNKDITPDQIKNTLMDAVEITGESLEGSILSKDGIQSLKNLTQKDMERIMIEKANKDIDLAKQAEQNLSFNKSMTAFKDSLLNLFTMFQPLLEKLTTAIQFLTKHPVLAKIAAGLIGLVAFGPMFVGAMGKLAFSMNPKNLASIFKHGGAGKALDAARGLSGGSKVPEIGGTDKMAETIKKSSESGSGIKMGGVVKLAAAIAIVLGALALSAGIMAKMGGRWQDVIALGAGVIEIAGAIYLASLAAKNIGISGIVKLSIAMAIVGVAMIPFAYAASIMGGIDWMGVLAAVGILALVMVGLTALGALLAGPQIVFLAIGVAALVGISAGLLILGVSLIAISKGMQSLTAVDWGGIGKMSSALLSLIPALMAFSIAGLMFVNPFTLIGMGLMVYALQSIAAVLSPMAESLNLGATSLDKMASNVLKLNDALSKLDFEKLEKLKEVSAELANAAGGTAVVDALGKLATALGGAGAKGGTGAGTEGRPIIIQLKMPNGRIIEEHIIKDIEKVS